MSMLFLLTGDVQIGKTRWLERLTAELAASGTEVAGVLAPGVWREREKGELGGDPEVEGAGRFEKLGIDNVLLPAGERIAFARRRDLALAEGTFDPASQSAAARLAWEIADEAIARVNAHFDRLADAAGCRMPAVSAEGCAPLEAAPVADAPDPSMAAPGGMFHMKHSFAQTDVSSETFGKRPAGGGELDAERPGGLLVVDELGRLELMRDCGLTSAVALLEAGPTVRFAHALVVVRDWLLPNAEERFGAAWGGVEVLVPDDEARRRVLGAFGLSA